MNRLQGRRRKSQETPTAIKKNTQPEFNPAQEEDGKNRENPDSYHKDKI